MLKTNLPKGPGPAVVIIPAFNEGNNIESIVRGMRKEFPETDVVVVDDGSSDSTCVKAKLSGATVLCHANNMGYGIALQTGYKYALQQEKYTYFVQMDGDGQHNYKDISKLLQPLYEEKADLVIGSRFIDKTNGYRIGKVRRFGMHFFRIFLYILTGQNIKDVTSGMQAFTSDVAQAYVSDEFPYLYPDANLLLLQIKNGYRITEIPTVMKENPERKSMHEGFGRQLFYVSSMILSILMMFLRNLGRKYAD